MISDPEFLLALAKVNYEMAMAIENMSADDPDHYEKLNVALAISDLASQAIKKEANR